MMPFAHLHVHSEYSLLDGACRIEPLVDQAASLGQTSLAITDHGVMYGVVDFYRACQKKGIHPVIGCEVYLAPHSRLDRSYAEDEKHSHLILLCENQTGYQNLIHMVSLAFSEGFYRKPRIDMELLRQYQDGLICLSGCLAGAIPRAIACNDIEKARELCREFLSIFDRKHFYLEIQDHYLPQQCGINEQLDTLSQEFGIELVATNDVHYLTREDADSQDVLLAIQTGKTVDDSDRLRFDSQEFYLKSGDEMNALFPQYPQALANTVKIAERCQVDFEFGKYHLPAFDVPAPYTALSYLQKLCADGFSKRYPHDDGSVWDRMQYEIDMIAKMGFVDYFLIVSDFIHYAKSQGIPVGPGRGSAAGSVVSYCLGITDLDPIRYSLYFERFLNPERVSMPDIDVDFCYIRRSEVIAYVTQKYGSDCVSQIVTFGTLAVKNAIRDVGRALSMPYFEVSEISKMIPEELHMTIDKALEINQQLKEKYDSQPSVRQLIDIARKLEGMPRHASTHAAGVVITKNPVDTYVPLARNDGQMVAQFNMVTLEELGLLKMDFLGLRTLTVISDAQKMIQKYQPDFNIDTIPLDDAATYTMLGQGETSGVFQLESSGITGVVTGLQPQSIEDITAVVALYRPGPMQSIPRYIENRHHPEAIQYKHPLLEPILKVTYGCMIYQEQVMQVFQSLAGYSLGKADMVRRAMSKKKMKELAKERITFIHGDEAQGIDGAIKRGVPESVANELFDEIMEFANYAFNKAHAACYALISYRTAYLKCHYPCEFMASLLTSILDSSDKVFDYAHAVKSMGIALLPPDINVSNGDFTVDKKVIRFGLSAIKGVGRNFMDQLVAEREMNGTFQTFLSFCERMSQYGLNRRIAEAMIQAGALDSLGQKRSQLLAVVDAVIKGVAKAAKKNVEGQLDLFHMDDAASPFSSSFYDCDFPDIPEVSAEERFAMEKKVSGLYLSGHPLDNYQSIIQKANVAPIRRIVEDMSGRTEKPCYVNETLVRIACVISAVDLKYSKKGELMAFVTIEDATGSIEVVVFAQILKQFSMHLVEGKPVLLLGKISARENEGAKILLKALAPLDQYSVADALIQDSYQQILPFPSYPSFMPSQEEIDSGLLWVYVSIPSLDNDAQIQRIKRILNTQRGDTPVVFCVNKRKVMTPQDYWCRIDISLISQLKNMLGEENVVIQKGRKLAALPQTQ